MWHSFCNPIDNQEHYRWLFAVAWADLDKEPLVLSVPNTGGRYYVIALFDMWSNVFASIGKRTIGTGAGSFLIAGPHWHGTAPADKDTGITPVSVGMKYLNEFGARATVEGQSIQIFGTVTF